MKIWTIIFTVAIVFIFTACRNPWPRCSHSYELSAMVSDHGALSAAAEGEERMLNWSAPTNPIPAAILSAVNTEADISGWWMTPTYDFPNTIAAAPIQSNRYLVVYFSDSCTSFYRYERHGFLNNGIFTLEKPVGDYPDFFNTLLILSTPKGNVLVPRPVAESKSFSDIMAGHEQWNCFYLAGWPASVTNVRNRLNLDLISREPMPEQ